MRNVAEIKFVFIFISVNTSILFQIRILKKKNMVLANYNKPECKQVYYVIWLYNWFLKMHPGCNLVTIPHLFYNDTTMNDHVIENNICLFRRSQPLSPLLVTEGPALTRSICTRVCAGSSVWLLWSQTLVMYCWLISVWMTCPVVRVNWRLQVGLLFFWQKLSCEE